MNYYAVFLSIRDEEKNKKYRLDHLAYLEEKDCQRSAGRWF